MAKKRSTLVFQLLGLFLVCVLSAIAGIAFRKSTESAVNADREPLVFQSVEKVVEVKEFPNKPFEIGDLGVKELNILPGQKFNVTTIAENEGWLDDLKFNIKNKWDKQITHIKIELEFPETLAAGRPLMKGNLDIGIHPQATGDTRQFGKPLTLNPGETFTYTLSKQWLEEIKKFLGLGGFYLANLNKATIRISNIYFDNDTVWVEGNWFKYNPTASGKYERISQ